MHVCQIFYIPNYDNIRPIFSEYMQIKSMLVI
jgi:hypothetical protein